MTNPGYNQSVYRDPGKGCESLWGVRCVGRKVYRILASALAVLLVVPWTAFADIVVVNSVSLGDSGGTISVQLQATNGAPGNPDRNGCNADATAPVSVTVTSSDTSQIPHPGSLTFTGCYTQQISFTILPSASGGTVTLSTSTTGGLPASKYSEAAISIVVAARDTTPPVLSLPGDLTAAAVNASGASVTYTVSAHDAVSGSVGVTCSPLSGSTFPLGQTTVTCSASDAAGNTISGSFIVTVVDQTAPVLNLPGEITAEATGPSGAAVLWPAVTATDNVDSVVTVSCGRASGSTFALGIHTVTCSAADAAGNEVAGSFTVLVRDTTAPDLSLPDDFTVAAVDASGAPVAFTAEASDLVDGSVAVTCSVASGSLLGLGSHLIGCFAVDAAGNEAGAAFKVTVADLHGPELTLPADMTVEANIAGGAVVEFPAMTAMDNVDGEVAVACGSLSGSTLALGTHTIMCSANDAAGNETTGSFTVTVRDTTAPVVTIGGVVNGGLYYQGAAAFSVHAADIADPNPSTGYSLFDHGDGTFTITAWATDASGNTGYADPVTYGAWGLATRGMSSRPNVKHGSTVPLRYTLTIPAGAAPDAMAFRGCVAVVQAGAAAPAEGTMENLSTNADHGCTFRYDEAAGQYVFNLSTRSMAVGQAYDIYVVFGPGQAELLGRINIHR